MEILFEDEARHLTEQIIDELLARSEFDKAWDKCDIDTQFEIKAELQKLCIKALYEGKKKRHSRDLEIVQG